MKCSVQRYLKTTFHHCLYYLNKLAGVDVEHTVAKCVMSKGHLSLLFGFNSTIPRTVSGFHVLFFIETASFCWNSSSPKNARIYGFHLTVNFPNHLSPVTSWTSNLTPLSLLTLRALMRNNLLFEHNLSPEQCCFISISSC